MLYRIQPGIVIETRNLLFTEPIAGGFTRFILRCGDGTRAVLAKNDDMNPAAHKTFVLGELP